MKKLRVYFFNFVLKESKKAGERCEVLIKERICPPFKSIGIITPIHFSDSLQFISPKSWPQPPEPIRYRMITCTTHDDLLLFFKTTDEEIMIIISLLFRKKKTEVTLYRWDQSQQKYTRVSISNLTITEERAIQWTLRSLSVRLGNKIGYCLF